jgi:hypothetical protein
VDDTWLILASRDDPAAFRLLYDRWAERLLAYFYVRVREPEVAADLLAAAFAVAYERRHRFMRPSGPEKPQSGFRPRALRTDLSRNAASLLAYILRRTDSTAMLLICSARSISSPGVERARSQQVRRPRLWLFGVARKLVATRDDEHGRRPTWPRRLSGVSQLRRAAAISRQRRRCSRGRGSAPRAGGCRSRASASGSTAREHGYRECEYGAP